VSGPPFGVEEPSMTKAAAMQTIRFSDDDVPDVAPVAAGGSWTRFRWRGGTPPPSSARRA